MFAFGAHPPWLEHLNDEQRAAATHAGGPLLVLAGAGTGKTTTLCARVAWLLGEGVPAERMLLLTFTRRAAREMVQRARAQAEHVVAGPGRLWGGTFHSVAHRMVRAHASALGLPPGFGVLDAGDAADLLGFVRVEHGGAESARRFPRPATMLDIYSRTINSQAPLPAVLAEVFPWCEQHAETLSVMFRAYVSRKRELGVVDLDDLLLYWRGLTRDELVGGKLSRMFDHVLVDEYQDVNQLQVDIVRGLRSHVPSVTAVGDDLQAIYGFRCASARHIRAFPEHFPGSTVVTLERNYRSTGPILAVANAISDQEDGGYRRTLTSERDGGLTPELLFPRDESEQAREVCDRVLAAREEDMSLREQAVLFRTGHDSDLLELELARRDIPFVKYGGLRYLDAAHVKDLIAALRLASNPADEVSWSRVLQLADGVGPVRARRILAALSPPHGGPPEIARWSAAAELVPPGARGHADGLMEVIAEGATAGAGDCGRFVDRVCEALAPLARARYSDWAVRAADYEQLVRSAGTCEDVRTFVADLVIDPPSSSADLAGAPHLDEDYLVLSTVHSAKGLEWEAVHVIAVYDGNFPADMSAGTREGVDEERRLLYVACTRARKRLQVYVPARYYHRGGRDDAHGYGKPSRFLTDAVRDRFVTRPPASEEPGRRIGAGARVRIDVSVEALFP